MAHLWDMLDAARAVLEFVHGRRFEDLLSNRMLRSAVERNIEIIGEAARRVSADTRDSLPDIPWRAIIGLRNVLVHEYDEIRHEILWKLCGGELPLLIRQLEATGADSPLQGDDA
ncbi:MAG: DUF86 domain-containing protein [Candidatus Hydrogenedentes bacterium]|nr:DUF86 domain-containing protein [Candidatus Hydrogenedentota bacterium]